MKKTVLQALIDETFYPITEGFVENVLIKRKLNGDSAFTSDVAISTQYKGALADCLCSLLQGVNFSEADKSIGSLTDSQRKAILKAANKLYEEIGEDAVSDGSKPVVYILNC